MSDHDAHEKHAEGESHGSSHGSGHGGHGGGHGGGGGGHEEGHEGAPEWLISFADNVALMMGFFVILLAMNMGPKGAAASGPEGEESDGAAQAAREADFVIGIREAFNNKIDLDSTDPSEAHLRARLRERMGGAATQDGPQGKAPELQAIRPSDYNRVTCAVTFDEGQSTLSSAAQETLAQTARRLRDQRWILEVRGHVSPFESMRNVKRAMQLSHDRAMATAFALVEGGVKWENIRVVACGDSDRIVPKSFDRETEGSNRRVEVIETNDVVGADPYSLEGGDKSTDAGVGR